MRHDSTRTTHDEVSLTGDMRSVGRGSGRQMPARSSRHKEVNLSLGKINCVGLTGAHLSWTCSSAKEPEDPMACIKPGDRMILAVCLHKKFTTTRLEFLAHPKPFEVRDGMRRHSHSDFHLRHFKSAVLVALRASRRWENP